MQHRLQNLSRGHLGPRQLCACQLGALILALLVSLALPASALAARFKITPHITNHTPTVNVKWPVMLTVTSGKKKLSGSVKYEFLFQGSVVSHQPGHKFTRGVYRDTMLFPPDSLGEPLTLRILVTVPADHSTEHIDWKVQSKQPTTATGTNTSATQQ